MKLFLGVQRIKRIAVNVLAIVGLVWSSLILWSVWGESSVSWESVIGGLPEFDYLQEIQQLRGDGRLGDAIALANAVSSLPGMPHGQEIKDLSEQLEKEHGSWQRRAKDALDGALTGSGDSPEALTAALITDFLVIGDIRDLVIQGGKAVQGEEVDEVVLFLSSAGLLASLATWVPEPASPAVGLTARPILTVFKGLRKIRALSDHFADVVIKTLRRVAHSGGWGNASALMSDMGVLMRRAPAGTLPSVMVHVDSAEDLAAVSKACNRVPEQTVAAMHVGGKDAVEWLRSAGSQADLQLGILLRKGARGFADSRKLVRGGKALYRGRVEEIKAAVTDLSIRHPGVRMAVLVVACVTSASSIILFLMLIVECRALILKVFPASPNQPS